MRVPDSTMYNIYVDGEFAYRLRPEAAWDDAATFIEKNTPKNTPLRRLAECGATRQPQEAATMLAELVQHHKEVQPNIRHTLRLVHRWLLKGDCVMITRRVTYEHKAPA